MEADIHRVLRLCIGLIVFAFITFVGAVVMLTSFDSDLKDRKSEHEQIVKEIRSLSTEQHAQLRAEIKADESKECPTTSIP